MRSIQLLSPRVLEVRDVPPPPEPGPGEVTVRVRAVGICGSDLHWYRDGRIGHSMAVYPHVLGHEPAGEVAAAGAGVDLQPGDRVAVEPAMTCGRCEYCLEGRHNLCPNNRFMGSPPTHGLFRELVTIPAKNALRLPDGFDLERGTLIEPVAIVLHVFDLVPIRVGDVVAVAGAGPMGMLIAAVALIKGASAVFAFDRVERRACLARQMGATEAATSAASFRDLVMDATRGRGADSAIDAAGDRETVDACFAVVRRGAKVAMLGLPHEAAPVFDIHTAMVKELDIQTIRRSNHNSQAAVGLLADGRVPGALITHRLPLEQTPEAFRMLDVYRGGPGKVIIELPASNVSQEIRR